MAHILAPAAKADLAEIWNYIAGKSASVETANRQLEKLANSFLLLASQPYLGRDRSSEFGQRRRSFAVGEYICVYRIHDAEVIILRVVHGRRDLESIFDH